MDTSAFIAPARISVLLVPIHPIKRSKFEQYANLIRGFSRIDLSDIPPDSRGERAIFSAGPNTPGALLFEYLTPTTYASSHPLAFLSEFQVHRRIHGIIGILDSSEYADKSIAQALSGFHQSLKELPKTFATKVYGFDPSEQQLNEGRRMKESEGLVMVPSTGDIAFYLHTVLADFASEVLWEFSNMAAQLESRTSIATPQEQPGLASPFSFIPHKPNAKSTVATYTSPTSPISPTSQQPVNLSHLGIAPPPQSRTALGLWGGSQSGNQDGFLYGNSIQSNMAMQPGAVPSPPPGSVVVDQRARKKVVGREKKLMGDMWLLAGRMSEAIACYNEAISLTKAWHDQVWQASALEGLTVALVIQAWSPPSPHRPHQRPQSPTSHSATPPPPAPPPDISTFLSSIPDRLSQASSLYEKMLPTLNPAPDQPPPDPDRAHPLVYAEACLRCARFLLAVWESSGSVAKALERLVLPLPSLRDEVQTSGEEARSARLRSLAPSNTVPRSSIATWVSLAYSPHLAYLALPTRLRVTGEIASIFGRIGYRRKESFVLRELAALCGEGVAGRGIEVFSTAPPVPATPSIKEEGDEPASTTSPSAPNGRPNPRINPSLPSTETAASIVRTTSDSAGNDSIIRVAEKVCEAFGIVVVPKASTRQVKEEKRRSLLQGRPIEIQESERDQFGWSGLQVGVLRDAISIAEALPDYQAAIRFTVTALRTLSDTMPPAEQYELSQNIPRIFAAATRRGAAFELEYWGPTQLVMSLEMAPLSPNRFPFEHSLQEAEAATAATGPAKRDPFIYNPKRPGAAAKVRPTLVQNESAEVFLTLQNPFLFDLEIQSIVLSTAGVPFASEPLATVVPPGSFHTVRLRGTALEAGLLIIRGCHIRLAGCTSREFLLPVWNTEEEAKRQKAVMLDTSRDRIKATGLGAFGKKETSEKSGEEGLKFLECTVVPEMPMLWMRSTSLTHGALMLYDGEVSTIRIALENTSTSPVDFVKLTFSDMHTTSTEAYVAENELAPGDAYEIESENLHRPVFSWSSTESPLILPGASTVLEVKCLGKVGCGSGTIQLDYGFVDRPIVKSSSIFHTRQLFCDIFMTVHRALVAHSLDILRLKALPEEATVHGRTASVAHLGRRGAALDQRLEESLKDVDDGEHCLVAVDVMNAYGKPFEVKIERCEDNSEFLAVRQRIEPGATLRMLLRLDRIVIPAEQLVKPIPSLSERQFVVSKVQHSAEDERLARELFWYREELLQRIQATWNEVGSLRSGSISLRGLQLTKPMLDVLRGDDVDIQLHLSDNPSSEPGAFQLKGRGQRLVYSATANEFIDICATVENHSTSTLHLSLRLELRPPESSRATPASLSHLARYVVIEGVSPVTVPVLHPGESQTVRVSICLLAEGQYELGCVVEERRGVIERMDGKERERRSYGAREPLVIDVDR